MVSLNTPTPELGNLAPDFGLQNVDGQQKSLADCRGDRGLLVMFICNHCPYVKSKLDDLVTDAKVLQQNGIGVVAIMSNDTEAYPDDSFDKMKLLSEKMSFSFPYLLDETQEVARAYGAVCTPDFFGYDAELKLRYRGRLDDSGREPSAENSPRDLVNAMLEIADKGEYSGQQIPSMGCSIKWRASI